MMMMMDGMMMIHGIWDTSVDTVAQMCGTVDDYQNCAFEQGRKTFSSHPQASNQHNRRNAHKHALN